MEIKKYLKELIDGNGHLNPFPNKTNDKAPDYGGYVKIDEKIYRISAWVKSKKNKKYISIRVIEADNEGNLYTTTPSTI